MNHLPEDFLQTTPGYGKIEYLITESDKVVPEEYKKGREEWETIKIVVPGHTNPINLFCPPHYKSRYFIQFGLNSDRGMASYFLIDNHGQRVDMSRSRYNPVFYTVDNTLYPFQLPDKLIDLHKKTSDLPGIINEINIPDTAQMFGYLLKMIPQMLHDTNKKIEELRAEFNSSNMRMRMGTTFQESQINNHSNLPLLPPSPTAENNNQHGGRTRNMRKTRKRHFRK